MRKVLLGVALTLWLTPSAHAAAATRIFYMSNWSGHTEIYAVDPSDKEPLAQLTHWHGACPELPQFLSDPVDRQLIPSPDGRYVLARCGSALWVMRGDGTALSEVAADGVGGGLAWAPNSRQFVYELRGITHIVNTRSNGDRLASPSEKARLAGDPKRVLAPNRRWVAEWHDDGAVSVRRLNNSRTIATFAQVIAIAWSPDGRRLAVESRAGLRVLDTKTRRSRWIATDLGFGPTPPSYAVDAGLGLAWSPDSQRLAYVTGKQTRYSAAWGITPGNLMTATLAGRIRTVIARDRPYGGRILAVAWTHAPRELRYRTADDPEGNALLAPGSIQRLAADGSRVAFIACDRLEVWTPSTGEIDRRGDDDPPDACAYRDLTGRYFVYDLALAGDRVMYALMEGCNSIRLTLHLQRLESLEETAVDTSFGNCGNAFSAAFGRLAGAGDLLVFGEWHERYAPDEQPSDQYPVISAVIRRVDGGACPCPAIASTGGPLYPADVNGGRIVAFGDNQTLVFDRDGQVLASLPVSPDAAQLSVNDLVLVVRGQLRHYDVRGASPLHTWPLANVPSGAVCGWIRCTPRPNLVLDDAARGLVAYTVDGQLHLLRLADGADSIVGQASVARFMDAGLVYADGARLRLVTFAKLPLRAF
jgi:WD40-like Beta Propeller Repeat